MTQAGSPLFLGIDLGTSSVKALVVDDAGHVVGQGNSGYPILVPLPGHAEQEPQAWWSATIQAVREALAALPDQDAIAALGITGQMHGTVLLDRNDQLLGPAIIWPDQRSHAEVEEITTRVGAAKLIDITGSPPATGFQAATLHWLHRHRPATWAAIRCVLLPKDYLRWRLTGHFATDPSDAAGTLLLDATTRTWATPLLNLLEIDPAWLPPIQPARSLAGELLPEAAEALGLRPGVPVVTGAADTPCSALGAGVVSPSTLLLTLSSGGQLLIPTQDIAVDPQGRIHTFCSAIEASPGPGWYQMAALLNVGLVLRWLRDQLWALTTPDAYTQITTWASHAPLGANGLLFLPYLIGERTPYMDAHARGALIGLTLTHGRPEIARAVLEGISMAYYHAFTVLQDVGAAPDRIVLAGGGAVSPFWRQLIADLFGRPVHPLAVGAQSALGAALLAGAGIGHFDLLPTAQAWARTEAPIQPNLEAHAAYQQRLPLFRQAYAQNRALMHQLIPPPRSF
ncbi:MAG: xylulokinase [Caldilineaceae bacterium]|nr:xylulokinase [Caldilineaceae bacterium]